MDETDLAKAGANALMKPITDLVDKIAGPGAEEIGLTIRDHIRVYRAKRQIELLRKMQTMIDDSGFEPQRIPIKVLLPSMEYAAVEDNEALHTAWAALLSNAANPADSFSLLPAFPEILRQISAYDASFLDHLFRNVLRRDTETPVPRSVQSEYAKDLGTMRDLYAEFRVSLTDPSAIEDSQIFFEVCMTNVQRLGVIRSSRDIQQLPERFRSRFGATPEVEHFYFTALGIEFLRVCQPPSDAPTR